MKDYGVDPIGDGMFRMVPSGDVVDLEERRKRLPERERQAGGELYCMGLTWEQLAMMQGGLDTLDVTRRERAARQGRA